MGDRVGPVRTEWQYDAAGRLLSIPSLISAMTFDARGRVLTANYVNGAVPSLMSMTACASGSTGAPQ